MILRLREGHKELTISGAEAHAITKQIAQGAEIVIIRGWTIMKGDIAHIDPGGLTREELDALDKKALPQSGYERASLDKVADIRRILEEKGVVKPKTEGTRNA